MFASSPTEPPPGKGVRKLKVADMAPRCPVVINGEPYRLEDYVAGKRVLDIGCGYGRNRKTVEDLGGFWVGAEPFTGGAHTVAADAQQLPFAAASFDVVIIDAVLEHIPDVGRAFAEIARILVPGGVMLGYVAFMECFHEISYSHLSFKALEHYAGLNGMRLEIVAGATQFGIDYHLAVLLHPLPFKLGRRLIASAIRGFVWTKSRAAGFYVRRKRRLSRADAARLADQYYQLECLRQSNGFTFVIRREARA